MHWFLTGSSFRKKKKRKERRRSRQEEETALCCCSSSGPWGKDSGVMSSRAETKAADKHSQDMIRSPCALNTSPSRQLPLFQTPNTFFVVTNTAKEGKQKKEENNNKRCTRSSYPFNKIWRTKHSAVILNHSFSFTFPKAELPYCFQRHSKLLWLILSDTQVSVQHNQHRHILLSGSWRTRQRKTFSAKGRPLICPGKRQVQHYKQNTCWVLQLYLFNISTRHACEGVSKNRLGIGKQKVGHSVSPWIWQRAF